MKYLSLILALLIPTAAFAGNGSGNVSNVLGLGSFGSVGPSSFISIPSTATVFTIFAGDSSTVTTGNFYPFYKDGVAFQAGANGTRCFNLVIIPTTANTSIQLVSATASFAFNAGSLTGGVFQGGATGKYLVPTQAAATQTTWSGIYKFGASTYGGFQAGNTQAFQMHMDCYDL